MSDQSPFLTITEIQDRLPHRFPFLLIDRVLHFEYGPDKSVFKGRKIVARKNVTFNEPYFVGHFPTNPVMPGVLQVEAMAQAGAMACAPEVDEAIDVLIAKISDARFRRPVVPGDTLELHAEIINEKRGLLVVECKALCDGVVVSDVTLTAKVTTKTKQGVTS